MAVKLGTKTVGSTVKMKVDGVAKDFIVVHQGNPDTSIYDSSCNGTWLLMKDIYELRQWHETYDYEDINDYENSTICSYLSTFAGLFESDIQATIKQVKIPYTKGFGDEGSLKTGSSGLSAKVFLLSYVEVGFNGTSYVNTEGTVLKYFDGISDSNRIGYLSGAAKVWWLRSPFTNSDGGAWTVYSDGSERNQTCNSSCGIRPALILPSGLGVDDDDYVFVNNPPTITSTIGNSGVNLGTKNDSFSFSYTVSDSDGDALTVTEQLDGETKRQFSATSGSTYTFESVTATNYNFLKILNGSHTLSIIVSDGLDSATFTATFTKNVTSLSFTLETPLDADDQITKAVETIIATIPSGAVVTIEVCNNGYDDSPTWEDVTTRVLNGNKFFFENTTKTADKWGYNVRMSVDRNGSSGDCYVVSMTGFFE